MRYLAQTQRRTWRPRPKDIRTLREQTARGCGMRRMLVAVIAWGIHLDIAWFRRVETHLDPQFRADVNAMITNSMHNGFQWSDRRNIGAATSYFENEK
jgi:hypothetical protein